MTDALVRYSKQRGEEVFFHSMSYNSQGTPIERELKKEKRDDFNEEAYSEKANCLIKKIEEEKKVLNLINNEESYIDHFPLMRKLSADMFNILYSKGYVFKDGADWYFDSQRVLKDPKFRESFRNLNFQPKKFLGNLEQMVVDISGNLRISRKREFATKIPGDSSLSLDPLWDLTSQQFSLKESPPTILICGRNMVTRYVLYSFLTNFAREGKIPFDKILIHNILNDSEGKRMSYSNKNIIYLEDISKNYNGDVIRYSLFRSSTFEKETANFSNYFLKEGTSIVHRIGNLGKFFEKRGIILDEYSIDNNTLNLYYDKMDSMHLKGALMFSQKYLRDLSRQIKREHDQNSYSDIEDKVIRYKTGLIMSYPFMPEICCKSMKEFNKLKVDKI